MALIFRKTLTHEPVVKYLVKTLARELSAGRRVLWLAPGGLAITVAAATSTQLTDAGFDQLDTDLSLDDRPAQVLKQVPKATLFNDYT